MTQKQPLYAAIGDGFSGATNSKAEAEEWVRNNKSGAVYVRIDTIDRFAERLAFVAEAMREAR